MELEEKSKYGKYLKPETETLTSFVQSPYRQLMWNQVLLRFWSGESRSHNGPSSFAWQSTFPHSRLLIFQVSTFSGEVSNPCIVTN